MSTICLTSPTVTSISVASSPTVITTTSNVVITPAGHFANVTYTTCVPIDNPILRRQQECTQSIATTSTFIPGVPVTRQVAVPVTITQFQTFSTTLFGTSCSVSSSPVSPSPSSSSSSVSSSSSPSSSQPESQSRTTTRATSVYVVSIPTATSGSSTLYSYSTYTSSDTADGAQATDTGLLDSPSQSPPSNKSKVVGIVCGSILGAVLLGIAGYFFFKKMTHTYNHRSEDQDQLRQIDPDQHQSGYSGSDPHYDQSQGTPHLQDPTGHGMQGQGSPFTHDGMQGQGGSFTPDTYGQGQGGSYGQPYGQDVGQYTNMHGPETQGMQGQGMDYTYGQGQGTYAGVEQYNSYDPFNSSGQATGTDMQHYAQQPNDFQSQSPFLDTPGGVQDQMSQAPFGGPPSVQAGSGTPAGVPLSLLLPAAAAAHRSVKRSLISRASAAEPLRSPKHQLRPNPF